MMSAGQYRVEVLMYPALFCAIQWSEIPTFLWMLSEADFGTGAVAEQVVNFLLVNLKI